MFLNLSGLTRSNPQPRPEVKSSSDATVINSPLYGSEVTLFTNPISKDTTEFHNVLYAAL